MVAAAALPDACTPRDRGVRDEEVERSNTTQLHSLSLPPSSTPTSKSSNTDRRRTCSKSSKRERGEGLVQNPARQREEKDLFKIQQDRDDDDDGDAARREVVSR